MCFVQGFFQTFQVGGFRGFEVLGPEFGLIYAKAVPEIPGDHFQAEQVSPGIRIGTGKARAEDHSGKADPLHGIRSSAGWKQRGSSQEGACSLPGNTYEVSSIHVQWII